MKVALIGPSNLGPYHLARYNALAANGVEVQVVACPVKEWYRPWEFSARDAHFDVVKPFTGRARTLMSEASSWLKSCRPDVTVVVGYNSTYGAAVASVALAHHIPRLLLMVGSEPTSNRSVPRELAKRAICRALFDGALVPGKRALDYAIKLGIPPTRVWEVGNAVDNAHFYKRPSGALNKAFLYIGRLSQEKNLLGLLNAYDLYRSRGGQWRLLLAGDGPLRKELESICSSRKDIDLLGWISYGELPELFRNSGALILPSVYEPWGLVVNEAMASRLPVLVSRMCGCYPELCREGVNGFGFNPYSVSSIATAMLRLSAEPVDSIEQMGLRSLRIVEQFGLDRWASTVLSAARSMATLATTSLN